MSLRPRALSRHDAFSCPIAFFPPVWLLGHPHQNLCGVIPRNLHFTSVPVFMNLEYLNLVCSELTNLTVCIAFFFLKGKEHLIVM